MSPPADPSQKWRVYVSQVSADEGVRFLESAAYDGTVYEHQGVWHDKDLVAHREVGVTIEVTLRKSRQCGFVLRLRTLLSMHGQQCAYVVKGDEKGEFINA